MALSAPKLNYPYIVRWEGICGGRPIVVGTRITVSSIIEYYKSGMDFDAILDAFPHLRPSQLHDAFSYYYDHQDEIEKEIALSKDEAFWRSKYPPGKGILKANGFD